MHLTPVVVQDFPNAVDVEDSCPMCTKKIPESFSERAGGNPRNSGFLS